MRPLHLLLLHGRKAATESELISDIWLLLLFLWYWSKPVSSGLGAAGVSWLRLSVVAFSRSSVVAAGGAHDSLRDVVGEISLLVLVLTTLRRQVNRISVFHCDMANASRRELTELYNTCVGARFRRIATTTAATSAGVDINFVVVLSLHFSSFAFNSLSLHTTIESLA